MTKRKFIPIVSWVICFVLMFTMILPLSIFAEPKPKADVTYRESVTKNGEKVSKKLLQQFDHTDFVTFLVKLKEQTNTEKVTRMVKNQTKNQPLTPYKEELIQRSAIVSNLRSTALNTQESLCTYLKDQQKDGNVKNFHSYYIVNALAITATKEVLDTLSLRSDIDKILPNEQRKLIGETPAQVSVVQRKNTIHDANPQAIEWNINQIGAPKAWGMGIDGTGTVIANIDTGVQWDHPALKTKYRGYNPSDPTHPTHTYNWYDATGGSQSAPYDDLEHGTHTMGTMVGSEPNGVNQIGVAPGAKWIAVKAFSSNGGSDADLLKAGEWIIAPKDAQGNPHPEAAPDVVNNSWGGGPGLDEWYRPMVKNWRAAGIFPEFSAGNTTGSNPGGPKSVANPANYPEAVATGATDSSNKLASFSLQGPSPYNEIKPELSAPGVNIRSSIPGGKYEGGWNGTSMAGPHVSAVVALLKQANASLTVDQIEDVLISTATPLTDSKFPQSPNNGYGHGLVNAFDAVSSVSQGLGSVSGRITTKGTDSEKPTFQHVPVKTIYQKTPLPLFFVAKDNIGITKIAVHYRAGNSTEWKTIVPTRISGDHKSGIYQTKIPGSDVLPPTLTYYLELNDMGDNKVTSPQYPVYVVPGISTGYRHDFETEPTEWTTAGDNNPWTWGKPTTGPMKAFSGEYVFATNLKDRYKENTNATLVMPPVDLPEETTYLQFKQWYDLESNYDFGNVLISTDQENWSKVSSVTGASKTWVDGEINLSSYAGKRIYIGFNLKTDAIINKTGWFLDDITLSGKSIKSGTDTPATPTKKVTPTKIKQPIKIQTINQPSALPLQATVTLVESKKSVASSPVDGSYTLRSAPGNYTVRAEAYGYKSKDAKVAIARDATTTCDLSLEAVPTGKVSGKIINKITGSPIPNATLMLIEDAVITPIKTDKNGYFTIEALEGTYTLRTIASRYYSEDTTITISSNNPCEKNLALKPFIGYEGEIGYDDGTAENAHAFYSEGNGWAVKMSLDPQKSKTALVTKGLFRFWNTEWPTPGGTDFEVALYDATGPEGSPGKQLVAPFKATAQRNGDWTTVDFSDKNAFVNGDFYMVYIQSVPNPNAPGIATDENGIKSGRSWQWVGGAWSLAPATDGNYMIRTQVSYEAPAPKINTPLHLTYTNQSSIAIQGIAAPEIPIKLQNKGIEVASGITGKDGSFSIPITLQTGENLITAVSATEHGSTESCTPVKIILDQTKPSVTVQSQGTNGKTNHEAITITGQASDAYLDCVKINGQKATLDKKGHYSLRVLLHHGINTFSVVAYDKAGNTNTRQINIDANFTPLEITNLTPTKDLTLKTGDTVKISFTSTARLNAFFTIRVPMTNLTNKTDNVTTLPIHETSPGKYVAYWTIPKNLQNIQGARIGINIRDDYGNRAYQTAKGRLYINTKK